MKPQLILKPIEIENAETQRIYGYLRQTVEGFNNYVADFFESIAIISEKGEALRQTHQTQEAATCDDEVHYLEGRIEELRLAMQMIATEMGALVEYSHAGTHADVGRPENEP